MTTDFRALCAELVAWAEKTSAHYYSQPGVLIRARAALAEPKLEEAPVWTEVICGDGAALLRDFVMVPIEEVVQELNQGAQARAVLARWGRSAPQPVPVSERWPEFSDCDSAERVWCWSWAIGTWRFSRINQSIHSHWLPAHALPLPGWCRD